MIQSFVFSDGKLVANNLDSDALRLVRADRGLLIWVNLFQPTPEETTEILEEVFSFHPLAIEDCLSESRYPKIEDYEDYLFLVMHAVAFSREAQFRTTELDFFIGKTFLVTHHCEPLSMLNGVIERVQKNPVNLTRGIDRLAHFILDTLIEAYNPVMSDLHNEVIELEDSVFSTKVQAQPEMIQQFRDRKRELNDLRQILGPQRDVLARIARSEFKIIRPLLLPYYRDLLSNLNQIDIQTHNLSDQLYLALDVYLNKSSYETNEVIKVLTQLTALLTPTILLGTWGGFLFRFYPGLTWPWAAALGGTALAGTLGLLIGLRRRHGL